MVYAAYFSGTGTTKKIVELIAKTLDEDFQVKDFSLPKERQSPLVFNKDDVVVFGMPVIAGRIPNLFLKYLATIEGNGALALPIVLYGNRNYDDALIELNDILKNGGLLPVGAGAFVGEHSFSKSLAKGRPDSHDLSIAVEFALKVNEKIKNKSYLKNPLKVNGTPYPYRGYYMPRDRNGNHIDIRKVKPDTNENCIDCKICAKNCPMQAIDYDQVNKIPGICMKCCSCIKKCPKEAKYFSNAGFIYHKEELEEMYQERKESEFFV